MLVTGQCLPIPPFVFAVLVVGCDFDINGSITPATDGSAGTATDAADSGDSGEASTSGGPAPGLDDESDSGGMPTSDDADSTGSAQDPGAHQTVFISSLLYTGALGGLDGADAQCQIEAEAALLPGTYRAWLSDSTAHALDRITGPGPWLDAHDNIIFNNAVGLQLAPVYPIIVQANGVELDWAGDVWTGTNLGGTGLGPFCGDWQTTDGQGTVGEPGQYEQGWTAYAPRYCQDGRRLYCFEVAD